MQIYKIKYVGKDMTFVQAELGVPVKVYQRGNVLVWEYEHLSLESNDCLTVSALRAPGNEK